MSPHADGSNGRAVRAMLLALVFVGLFKTPAQTVLARLSGAVMANSTHTHTLEFGRRVDVNTISGDRRTLLGRYERAAALHVLVVWPEGVTADGSGSRPTRAPEVELTYEPFRRVAVIGGEEYRLRRGNLFVVRMTDDPRPVVAQLRSTIRDEPDEWVLLRAFCLASHDAEVRSAVTSVLAWPGDAEARGRPCAGRRLPAAAT